MIRSDLPFQSAVSATAALALLAGLGLPTVASAEVPAGDAIDEAIIIDVTDDGFVEISKTLPDLVPTELPIPDVVQKGSLAFDWELSIRGIDTDISLGDVSISPQNGYLQVSADAQVLVNTPSNPAKVKFVYKTPGWLGGPWTIADCDFHVRPVDLTVDTKVYMNVVVDGDGNRVLDATISTVDWDWTLTGTDIQVDNCWIGSINDILEYIDFSLFDLVLGPVEGLIDDQIQDLVTDLEPQLEDAFNSFRLDEEFEFNDAMMHVQIEPYDVAIRPAGMRLVTRGLAEADESPCVAGLDLEGSRSTAGTLPGIKESTDGVGRYDIGIKADDDFVNQVLFAATRGGALCFDLSGSQGDLPINTGLLGLVAGDAFDDLFPEARPMAIEVRPTQAPYAVPTGPHDVTLRAEALQLDMYAELDGREALIVGMDLDLEAGADMLFDGTTGELALDVALSGDDLDATVRPNELAPGREEEIAGNVGGLFDALAAPILGDALSGLSFQLPAFGTVGLQSLDAGPTGGSNDWFGFFAGAGPVTYGTGGCGGAGGCGDTGGEGCDSGCGPGGIVNGRGLTLVLFPLLVAALRRRRKVQD